MVTCHSKPSRISHDRSMALSSCRLLTSKISRLALIPLTDSVDVAAVEMNSANGWRGWRRRDGWWTPCRPCGIPQGIGAAGLKDIPPNMIFIHVLAVVCRCMFNSSCNLSLGKCTNGHVEVWRLWHHDSPFRRVNMTTFIQARSYATREYGFVPLWLIPITVTMLISQWGERYRQKAWWLLPPPVRTTKAGGFEVIATDEANSWVASSYAKQWWYPYSSSHAPETGFRTNHLSPVIITYYHQLPVTDSYQSCLGRAKGKKRVVVLIAWCRVIHMLARN